MPILDFGLTGSGAPGGSDTQIQFNDALAFGGDADFTWNKTTNVLGLNAATAAILFGTDTTFERFDVGQLVVRATTNTNNKLLVVNGANPEYGSVGWDGANNFRIGTQGGLNGGTARNTIIGSETSAPHGVILATDSTSRWRVEAGTGHVLPWVDATYDVGSTTLRPRVVYAQNQFALKTDGVAGNYLTTRGLYITDAAGTEILRLVGTDPNSANYNSGNLYLGYQAGLAQPTDNVDAGYLNTGIGYKPLLRITTGQSNTAIGSWALDHVTTGVGNIAIGEAAASSLTTGTSNTAVGYYADVATGALTNTIALGNSATVSGSNRAVIGNSSLTDVYLGSESAAAMLRAAGVTVTDASNIVLGTSTGTKIGTATNQKLAFFNSAPITQPTRGATLTNSVTAGGTDDTIANYTDLTTYATDAAAIRNNLYQLARAVRMHDVALRALGLES